MLLEPSRAGRGILPPKSANHTHPHDAHAHNHTPAPCSPELTLYDTHIKEEQDNAEMGAGGTPHWLRPINMADAEDRKALGITSRDYGTKWRATFRSITGNAPKCGPGERDTARQYWSRVRQAMRHGDWSTAEWGQLYRIEKVWGDRWRGKDARFEVVGTRPGGLTMEERVKVQSLTFMLRLGDGGRL